MKNQPISGNSATSPTTQASTRADDFLTSSELATVLKISIRAVQRREHEGMPTHRRHRTARFPLSQIREWMKASGRA